MASSTKVKTNSSAEYNFAQHLLCLSYSKDFNCALEEWTLIGSKDYDTLEALCICQHKIKHAHFAYNKKTGKTITVGSDCKKKFMTSLKSEEGNLFLKYVRQWILENGYENIEDIEEYARKVKESLYKVCFDKYLWGKNRRSLLILKNLRKELIELTSIKGVDYLTDILELVVVEIYMIGKADEEIEKQAEINRLAREAAQNEIDRKAAEKKALEAAKAKKEKEEKEQKKKQAQEEKERKEREEIRLEIEEGKKRRKEMDEKIAIENKARKLKYLELEKKQELEDAPILAAFTASLSPKDRIIHDLAAKMLKTRYDPKRSNAFLKSQKK